MVNIQLNEHKQIKPEQQQKIEVPYVEPFNTKQQPLDPNKRRMMRRLPPDWWLAQNQPSATSPEEGGGEKNSDGNYQRPLTEVCAVNPCLTDCPDSQDYVKCPQNAPVAGTTPATPASNHPELDAYNIIITLDKYKNLGLTDPTEIEHFKNFFLQALEKGEGTDNAFKFAKAGLRAEREAKARGNLDQIRTQKEKLMQTIGEIYLKGIKFREDTNYDHKTSNWKPKKLVDLNMRRTQFYKDVKCDPPPIYVELDPIAIDWINDKRKWITSYSVETLERVRDSLQRFHRKAHNMNTIYPFMRYVSECIELINIHDELRKLGFTKNNPKHPDFKTYSTFWDVPKSLTVFYFAMSPRVLNRFRHSIQGDYKNVYLQKYGGLLRKLKDFGVKTIDVNKSLDEIETEIQSKTGYKNQGVSVYSDYLRGSKGLWLDSKLFKGVNHFGYKNQFRTVRNPLGTHQLRELAQGKTEWVFDEFAKVYKITPAQIKELFYNDPMAILIKHIIDYFVLVWRKIYIPIFKKGTKKGDTKDFMIMFWNKYKNKYSDKLRRLITTAINRAMNGEQYTRLYFLPMNTLAKFSAKNRRTNHLLVEKMSSHRPEDVISGIKNTALSVREGGKTELPNKVPVPKEPDGKRVGKTISQRQLIRRIDAGIKDGIIRNEKDSLIARCQLLGCSFSIDPNLYSVKNLKNILQSYYRTGHGYKATKPLYDGSRKTYKDYISRQLTLAEQYGLVGLSKQGDPNNRHYLINALCAFYVYEPRLKRPQNLLGEWIYDSAVSTDEIGVWVRERKKEVKIAIKGTSTTYDVAVDLLTVLVPVFRIQSLQSLYEAITSQKPMIPYIKSLVDKIMRKYPRETEPNGSYQYSFTAHSLGGTLALEINALLAIEYRDKTMNFIPATSENPAKYELKKAGTPPYKWIQTATFTAGAGIVEALNKFNDFKNEAFVGFGKPRSRKDTKIWLRQYRVEYDPVSALGSATPTDYKYTLTFKAKCENTGASNMGERHSMKQFLHDVFLPDKDKSNCEGVKVGDNPKVDKKLRGFIAGNEGDL